MLKDVIEVKPLKNYRLWLRFEDGMNGEVNVADLVTFTGVFAPLKDHTYFAEVKVNPEIGTICWPNGADLDPDVLYAQISGESLPDFEQEVLGVGEGRARYRASNA